MPRLSASERATRTPSQRVTPVQERSRQRIDGILAATAGLLQAQGIEAVSMLAIAEAAGMTPATVYRYFDNRIAVFAALAERTMAEVDAALTSKLQAMAAAEALSAKALLDLLYRAYRDAPGYVAILRALRAEPALQELVAESNRRMAAVIAEVLAARTNLSRARAGRIGWILSEICEEVVEAALVAEAREARALMAEMTEMVEVLLAHYLAQAK
ncbi:MAG: putative HTH-type protein slmA [Moraxellaceae bacterium]|jgi:AcrR family transcriptional regulator|nr:putative HTH-type protein slmA [Moraxellaceae bacterium]